MEIKYVCSLGPLCHSSNLLKNNELKKCSYPFDWIFSNYDDILHCIEDDFNIFLNKSDYISLGHKTCNHAYYKGIKFHHHNPLNDENDYNYFIRCIDRFRLLLQYEEPKLFVMIFVNNDQSMEEDLRNKIIDFNDKFSKYTQNYTLLIIHHLKNKINNSHTFDRHNNIDFLELHTLSVSDGINFTDNRDNNYLNNLIKENYKFNIE